MIWFHLVSRTHKPWWNTDLGEFQRRTRSQWRMQLHPPLMSTARWVHTGMVMTSEYLPHLATVFPFDIPGPILSSGIAHHLARISPIVRMVFGCIRMYSVFSFYRNIHALRAFIMAQKGTPQFLNQWMSEVYAAKRSVTWMNDLDRLDRWQRRTIGSRAILWLHKTQRFEPGILEKGSDEELKSKHVSCCQYPHCCKMKVEGSRSYPSHLEHAERKGPNRGIIP